MLIQDPEDAEHASMPRSGRIARCMQVTRTDDLQAYYQFLRTDADEAQALVSDLLISVTTFFRDAEVFELLKGRASRNPYYCRADVAGASKLPEELDVGGHDLVLGMARHRAKADRSPTNCCGST